MLVKARVRVENVTPFGDASPGRQVAMRPVYSADPADPNYSYSQATPNGSLTLTITNPAAWPLFEVGAVLDVTFSPYDPAAPLAAG